MNVNLYWLPAKRRNDQFEVYRRCAEAFKAIDVHLNFLPDVEPNYDPSCDVAVIQHYFATGERISKLKCPVVIEETEMSLHPLDMTPLGFSSVIRYYKYVLGNSLLNHPKLKPGIHIGMYDRMGQWANRRPFDEKSWSQRPIDVLFCGRVQPEVYRPAIALHRSRFCDVLDDLRKETNLTVVCKRDRVYYTEQYCQISRLAKIIVSPWGHGELCYRDFEAMFDECILIKPRPPERSNGLGGFLDAGRYLECHPDASDLAETILNALDNWQLHEGVLKDNYRLVMNWYQPETIAAWWKQDIQSAL